MQVLSILVSTILPLMAASSPASRVDGLTRRTVPMSIAFEENGLKFVRGGKHRAFYEQ